MELEKRSFCINLSGLLFFLFFVQPISFFGQSVNGSNKTDSKGIRQGDWVLFWKDIDTLNRCGNGNSCTPDMIALGYVNEGYGPNTKFMTCTYVDGSIEGLVEKFYPN